MRCCYLCLPGSPRQSTARPVFGLDVRMMPFNRFAIYLRLYFQSFSSITEHLWFTAAALRSQNILEIAVGLPVPASQLKWKFLRQICLLSGYFGKENVRWGWWTGCDDRDWFVALYVCYILTFLLTFKVFFCCCWVFVMSGNIFFCSW